MWHLDNFIQHSVLMMAGITSSFCSRFISLFILLFHLGCFMFTVEDGDRRPSRKRKVSPVSSHHLSPMDSRSRSRNALSSSWFYLKKIFASKPCTASMDTQPATATVSSARSSLHSVVSVVLPEMMVVSDPQRKVPSATRPESDISADHQFFPLRNDIFPCPACGEVFQKPQNLEQHQALKHAVSELIDGDSGNNIVRIIFKTGWTDSEKIPKIQRILKIHNSSKILARFEEYRESVKSKAARNGAVRRRDERCIADGNELLRFHCSTFLCNLGQNGNSSVCNHQYCSVCGIIRTGFSPKLDGISTLSTSWRAHATIPEDIEDEFRFMNVKRAMLVCRVVAGRIGSDQDDVDKEDGGFDSVVGRSAIGGGGSLTRLVDDEELLVFNPRSVLPCFVIVYSV